MKTKTNKAWNVFHSANNGSGFDHKGDVIARTKRDALALAKQEHPAPRTHSVFVEQHEADCTCAICQGAAAEMN